MEVPIYLLILVTFVLKGIAPTQGNLRMKPIKIECDHDPNLLTNVSCSMLPHPVSGGLITVDAIFTQPATHIWVQHAVLEKIDRTNFQPTYLKVNVDLCDFYRTIKKTILNRFMIDFTTEVKDLIHDCPYSGHVYIKNLTLAGGGLYLKLFRPKRYRLDYRFYNDRNETYFYMKFYGIITKN